MNSKRRNWHRLFGVMLMDYFHGSGYEVELEKDLSVHKQLLDIVVVRASPCAKLLNPCAGFEDIAEHNLITFKAATESMNWWAIDELVGHYVNYRKCLGLKSVSENSVRLYAVSARHPQLLDNSAARLTQPGVYELTYGHRSIRIVVMSEIGVEDRNAIWELFSGKPELERHGSKHYIFHKDDAPGILSTLFTESKHEGFDMSYTWQDFINDFVIDHVAAAPPEKIISQFSPETRLAGLPPETRLAGLPPETRLAGLPQEVIEEYLAKLRETRGTPPTSSAYDEPVAYSIPRKRANTSRNSTINK